MLSVVKFYKIISGEKFIGVATSSDLRKYYEKRNKIRILTSCLEDECQYIQLGSDLFHDNWMRKEDNKGEHAFASVIEITEEQYNYMNKDISEVTDDEQVEWSQEPEEKVVVPEEQSQEEIVTIEFVREKKLKEMSMISQEAIFAGFDVVLSDGLSHHFSLNTQDQLNLITLSAAASTGQPTPYHADGEPCKFYSPLDLQAVLTEATSHKTYHTSYFNSLKAYINSLDNVDDIVKVEYGMVIPVEYQSDVLQAILYQMGVLNQ